VLAPVSTFTAWRRLVLDLTAIPTADTWPQLPDSPELDGDLLDEPGELGGMDPADWWESAPPVGYFDVPERARRLIEAGVGRRRLSRELGVSEYEARQLLERTRQHPANHNGAAMPAAAGSSRAGEGELT
jgi:hypothetical protein